MDHVKAYRKEEEREEDEEEGEEEREGINQSTFHIGIGNGFVLTPQSCWMNKSKIEEKATEEGVKSGRE